MKSIKHTIATTLLVTLLAGGASSAQAAPYDTELLKVQQSWAHAVYKAPDKKAKYQALRKLSNDTLKLTRQYPKTADVLVWDGIVSSTFAAVHGGFGALRIAKRSRNQLEKAKQLNPKALRGSAYTSLGTLYAKVPGWPIGFGNRKKAESNFRQALKINPYGIDPNFFYAEFLADTGRKAQAIAHLKRALKAPSRGRPIADAGRRQEVSQLLKKLQQAG